MPSRKQGLGFAAGPPRGVAGPDGPRGLGSGPRHWEHEEAAQRLAGYEMAEHERAERQRHMERVRNTRDASPLCVRSGVSNMV